MQPTAFETEVEKRLEDESCVLQIVKGLQGNFLPNGPNVIISGLNQCHIID